MSSGSTSDMAFVGSWRAHQIVAEILSSPQAEQSRIIEVACGADDLLRSRVVRMIASIESATRDETSDFVTPDDPHGTGDLIVSRKVEVSATRETWLGYRRDSRDSRVLIHIFSRRNESFDGVVAGFKACGNPSLENLVQHGMTPGGRAFIAFNRVNGVPIHQYLGIFTTSSLQRGRLFDRVREAVRDANDAGLHHENLTRDSILISEIDGKPFPVIVGMGLQSLSFCASLESSECDRIQVERIVDELESDFDRHETLTGGALVTGLGLHGGACFEGGSASTVLPRAVLASFSNISRQSILGAVLFVTMLLSYLCISSFPVVTSSAGSPTSDSFTRGAKSQGDAHAIRGAAEVSTVEEFEAASQQTSDGIGSWGVRENASLRMTGERRSASAGGGDLSTR